jgi:hypothetical protein
VLDPLDNQPWESVRAEVTARATEPPLIDTMLEPGDALYLPRGTIHSALAQGDTSIHLTVGVHPVTRYQLVRHLLELAQDDPALRASLPMGVDLTDPAVLAVELADTVAALHERLDDTSAADVAARVGTNLMQRTRPEPIGPLAQLAAAEAVTTHTPLRLRAGLRVRLEQTAAEIRLVLVDRTITFPTGTSDALKTILTAAPFTPADLSGLGADEQVTLTRRLLREGVLVLR